MRISKANDESQESLLRRESMDFTFDFLTGGADSSSDVSMRESSSELVIRSIMLLGFFFRASGGCHCGCVREAGPPPDCCLKT